MALPYQKDAHGLSANLYRSFVSPAAHLYARRSQLGEQLLCSPGPQGEAMNGSAGIQSAGTRKILQLMLEIKRSEAWLACRAHALANRIW